MSTFAIVLIAVFFLVGIFFLAVKRKRIAELNRYLQNGEFQNVLNAVNKPHAGWFLNMFIRDLYTAKAYLSLHEYDKLKEHLRTMFQTQYSKNNTLFYLTLYFHIFVHQKDAAFADELLKQIEDSGDTSSIKYCVWTKQVLLEGRGDLAEEIEAAANTKEYSGFALGVIVYLLAIEKEREQDCGYIWDYLDAALSVMQPNDIYVEDIRQMMKRYEEA